MADHAQSHHEHGTMDIRAQEKTYAGFLKFTTWSVGLIIVALIFLGLAGA